MHNKSFPYTQSNNFFFGFGNFNTVDSCSKLSQTELQLKFKDLKCSKYDLRFCFNEITYGIILRKKSIMNAFVALTFKAYKILARPAKLHAWEKNTVFEIILKMYIVCALT